MSTSPTSGISGYAFTVKDLNKARQLGIGDLWNAISAVRKGEASDVVEISKGCKAKAKDLSLDGMFEAVRLYVKLKFNQIFSAIYNNTLGQVKKFGEAFVQKLGGAEALKNGLNAMGPELDKQVQAQAETLTGIKQADVDASSVEKELGLDVA